MDFVYGFVLFIIIVVDGDGVDVGFVGVKDVLWNIVQDIEEVELDFYFVVLLSGFGIF